MPTNLQTLSAQRYKLKCRQGSSTTHLHLPESSYASANAHQTHAVRSFWEKVSTPLGRDLENGWEPRQFTRSQEVLGYVLSFVFTLHIIDS